MIEKVHTLSQDKEKNIEKVIVNEHLHYMHVILPKGEGLPLHQSNANVYMLVLKGTLTLALNHKEPHRYTPLTLLEIPFDTTMSVRNVDMEPLEITIVKAPAPGTFYKK
ncbi:MAG TPA: cupin domain-containing protein [Bacillota bacterium]|nr:cupin domain-containing protein [Bacillota bacterium]HPJ24035.1 cupin domain-containing protein [Bacillota bacterium]